MIGFRRLIGDGGYILMACHVGDEVISVDKRRDDRIVSVGYLFFRPDDILQTVKKSGFVMEEAVVRYSYAEVEYPSKRVYILTGVV